MKNNNKMFYPNWPKNFIFLTIFFVAIIFSISFPFKTFAGENWYNDSWSYRKKITIDHTKVFNTNQSDFPVLISLADSDLQIHGRSDGHDILFTDSSGTIKIPYEREQYISSTGNLVAWVKIASLSHMTDSVIYMYYGNSEASDQQDITGETWGANFKGVWHSQDAAVTTLADSTVNANTGAKKAIDEPAEITGKIGQAQNYDGIDDYIRINPTGTLSGSFTVSTWVKVSDAENSYTIFGTRNGDDMSFDFKLENGETIHGDIGNGTDWITNEADANLSYSYNTWYQITYVITPIGYTIYLDGNEAASGSYPEDTPLLFDSGHNLFIGQVGYDEELFNGVIDEVRISDIARSGDWIQTEYNNQNSPSTFYSLGNETIDDETSPTISNINSLKADGAYKTGAIIDINVTFSEDVTSTGNIIVNLDTGGSCSFTITNSNAGSCNYTIGDDENSSDLNVSSVSGTIKDATGNSMINFTPATNLATNKNLIIDTIAPTVPGSP